MQECLSLTLYFLSHYCFKHYSVCAAWRDRIVFLFTFPFRILYFLFIFKHFYTFRGSFIFLNPWYCTLFYSIDCLWKVAAFWRWAVQIFSIYQWCTFGFLCLCFAWEDKHKPYRFTVHFRVCVFCMAMSLPVLLTRVIFIVSISTFPACWAGLEDLSKLTSEQQHFHRRGLFTQTRGRPLNGGDISSILLPILAEIVFVLHSEGVQLHFQLPKAPRWPSRATARWEKM